jgi:hypothetical protein
MHITETRKQYNRWKGISRNDVLVEAKYAEIVSGCEETCVVALKGVSIMTEEDDMGGSIPVAKLLRSRPVASSVVRDLLVLAIAGPHTTTDGSRYAYTETHGSSDDDESDGDLSPHSLLAGHVPEEGTATLALVRLPLVQHSLPRRPHGALLDAAIDRMLRLLLCGGDREGHAALDIAFVFADGDAEMCLALGGALVEGATRLAEGFGVLVEGRVGVRRVGRPLLLGSLCVGGCGGHCGVVGGRGAERLLGTC